jgi:hypothetical protein
MKKNVYVLNNLHKAMDNELSGDERENFFRAVSEIVSEPMRRKARKQSGLAKFEMNERRCVYPDGPHPRLAFNIEGTPEYEQRQKLLEQTEAIFQSMRLQCGI